MLAAGELVPGGVFHLLLSLYSLGRIDAGQALQVEEIDLFGRHMANAFQLPVGRRLRWVGPFRIAFPDPAILVPSLFKRLDQLAGQFARLAVGRRLGLRRWRRFIQYLDFLCQMLHVRFGGHGATPCLRANSASISLSRSLTSTESRKRMARPRTVRAARNFTAGSLASRREASESVARVIFSAIRPSAVANSSLRNSATSLRNAGLRSLR